MLDEYWLQSPDCGPNDSKLLKFSNWIAREQTHQGLPLRQRLNPRCCRKMGVSEQTCYRWKKQDGGLGVLEIKRLKLLEEENRRLKRLVADVSLDKVMLQDVLAKKL